MLAGIDVGSTGLKVALFSEQGQRLHYAYREYSLSFLGGGQVVIDPNCWWECLCSCLKELSGQCDLRQVAGIAVSHANAIILADAQMQPISPAIMQLDKRGAAMVPVIERDIGSDEIFRITGNNNTDGFVWGPTLKWLAVNQPEDYKRVRYLFNPSSYLLMRLTGVYCMDHTRAATTMLYNPYKGEWDPDLCRYFGLTMEQMPPLHKSSDIVGTTLADPATGLPAGIPVAAGAMDTMAAMVGLGSGRQENALIMGSVGRFVLAPRHLDRRFLNTVMPDRSASASMTPVNNAGIAVRWARDILFSNRPQGESCYDKLDHAAAAVSPGADGLLFMPYLTGASCPLWDSSVRGAFLHMEAYHKAGHLARAVLEGVGYTLADSFRILHDEVGISDSPIYCGGGGSRSRVWMEILCNIFGQELIIPENLETETIGCAILAGMGTGVLSKNDLATWNRAVRKITPDPKVHRFYTEQLKKFRAAYGLLQEAHRILDQ